MFLKRLTCHGFKSFGDKTDFDFGPGVTGIVGPNGCGKSNVVDAVKWVLGDQSARSLRGKQMLDVIFNGSGTRKSAGMAQVDLVFDNADRVLGRDTDEVTITRRLYRSGESGYLINNEVVRLRDIRELFMDTGVGAGAYAIIEQGKVDVLLQANPQERRLIFEEAAGISRYKARKREAERKLERVDQNLLRIEDIVEEVEKRLRSVKYQAGKARSWQEYDRQLREKRASFSLAEYHRLTQKRDGLVGRGEELEDQATAHRTAISRAEARSSELDRDLIDLDQEIQQLEHRILTNASEITATTERIDQSRQRVEELVTVRAAAQRRLAVERQRAAKLRRQIQQEQRAVETLQAELHSARAQVDTLTGQDGELARSLTGLKAKSEDEKAQIFEVLRRSSQLSNEANALEQRTEHLNAERDRHMTRREDVQHELAQLRQHREHLEARSAEIRRTLEQRSAELEEKRRIAARIDADRSELNLQLSAAKEYRSGLLSRRQILTDLESRLEGVDAGVRELLHRKEQDSGGQAFPYVVGMVADLVAVDVANAMLIETALGEYDQYLVVSDSLSFFSDAEEFGDFPGRVHAICIDRLPPFIDGRDFTQQEGFVAYAMDLVRSDTGFRPLIRHLLGKTIIVRTFEDARKLARQNPPTYRYITQSGEVFDPMNAQVELGPAGGRSGLISRKSELREIGAQIGQVDERISDMGDRIERTSAEVSRLQREQDALRSAMHEADKADTEIKAACNTNDNAMHRLEQELPLLASEIAAREHQIRETTTRIEQDRATVSELEQERERRESHVRDLEEETNEINRRRAELADALTEAKVVVAELAQRQGLLAEALRGLRDSQQASEQALHASEREAHDAHQRIVQTERTLLSAQSRLAELFGAKERLDVDVLSRQRQREHIRLEKESLSGEIKRHRNELDETEEKLHRVQMEAQEVRIRIEELVSRVREELSIDLAESYASYEHQDQDWSAVEAEIEELKGKIKRLGNVNLDAIDEQEELEKRSEFLGGQRDDLRRSQRQLQELIEQLNNECRERFAATFEAVRGYFQDLFRKLFGGGKADVMLEEPGEGQTLDVLEAGIEIQARPPGKELQSISLLSGGEKTMTAIALLLAIFRSRPSPFAILDEVDAALDEANNERFNRIVGEFLDKSQFVIITHSKRTMTIADVLYGVTMQEAGVSKRVSVKFDTQDDQTAAA